MSQDGDVDVDLISDNLMVQALNGVDLDTTVATLHLTTSNTGEVIIDESDDLILTQAVSADGSILVTAQGTYRHSSSTVH